MTTKAQINALICDYLDRNYNNLDDILPTLKKLLKLTNRTKPFGKLEEIVSAFKKADQNNKRKHDNNEDGQSAKKSRDNIVTSDNLTLPDIIESSTESTDIIARVAGNRRASSSLNKDKNETISITSPSQDRRESNEIQGIGKSLLSDEDGIILCIKSINKNIDDCYHDGTAEVLSEQDDNLITKVKSLRPAVSMRASKTAAKLASNTASSLASGSESSSKAQPMQNQFKTSVSKKLPSKTKKTIKVSPNSKNTSCDSADEEIFMEEDPKSTVNSVNTQIFDKKVPEKQTDSKSENVAKSPLKVSNKKSRIQKSSDAKFTKNKPTTRADSKSLPIVKTNTQLPKETFVNYDSDSSQWSIDGEEVQPIKLTKNLKPSKIVTNDVCEANKSRAKAYLDERDVNIPSINIESDNGSVPISSGDSLTSKQAKTTQSPSKTDVISKSTDVSSDSPPIAKVVMDSFNSNRTEHSTSENNAKESVNKSMRPTIATVRNEPPKRAPSTSSDSDDDVQLPTTPEKYSLEQIKITALSPTKGNTRIVTEIFTRAQQSSKSKKKSPHNEEEQPASKAKTADNNKTTTKPLNKNGKCNAQKTKPVPKVQQKTYNTPKTKSSTRAALKGKTKPPEGDFSDKEENFPTARYKPLAMKTNVADTSSNAKNVETVTKLNMDSKLTTTSDPSKDVTVDKRDLESNHSNDSDGEVSLKQKTSEPSSYQIPQKTNYQSKNAPSQNPAQASPDNDFSVHSSLEKEKSNIKSNNAKIAVKYSTRSILANSKSVVTKKPPTNTPDNDSSDEVESDVKSNEVKIIANDSTTSVPTNPKSVVPQKPSAESSENDSSEDEGEGNAKSNKGKITVKNPTTSVSANSKSIVTQKPSANSPDSDSSVLSSSLNKDESNVKSNEAKITVNNSTTSVLANSVSVVSQNPSANPPDSDSSGFSSSDEDESNVKSNKAKITVNNSTTSFSVKSKAVIPQKPSANPPDSDSSDFSSSDEIDAKSNKAKITIKNPTTSILANSKSKVPQKQSVSSPDIDSSGFTSDEDENDAKSRKEKITIKNSTTSVSANSKSKVHPKPSVNPPDTDSSELTSSDEDESDVKSNKAKITVNNSTTSFSVKSKAVIPQKPSANPSDSSELTSSDEDENDAKSRKAKITIHNSTTSVVANSKSKVPPKPSANPHDTDSSDLSSSDEDEINIKSNNVNKFSTSVSANSKSTVSQRPTLASLDSSSSSNLTSDIMKSKVTKTYNTIPSTSISGNLESRANKSILNNEDLSVMKNKKSPPTTKSTSNNLPLLITNRSGKTASPPSKTKKAPKSSEFIDSDSSDEDFANPPLPINNATSKISIISQLPPKGAVTKLSTLSLKPSHKSMLNLESDLSLESNDEEDVKIISEAVARSAKKALISNKPKLPEKTIVASVPRPALKATSSDSSSSDEDDKPTINKTKPITNIKKDKILSGNAQANVGLIKNVSNVIKDIKVGKSLSDFSSDSESELPEKISKDSKTSNPSKTGDNSNAILQKTLEDFSSSSDSIDIKTPTLQPANSESLMFSSISPDKQSKKTDLLNFTLSGLDNNKKANDSEDIQNCVVRALNILTREEEEMRHAQHIKGQNNSDGRLNNQSDSNAMIKIKMSIQELNDSESSSDGDSNRPVVKARTQIAKAAATDPLLSSDDGDDDIAREIPCAQPVKTLKVTKSNKKPVEETSKRSSNISDGSSLDEFKEPLSKKTKQDRASLSPSKTSMLILKAKSKTKSTKMNSKSKTEGEEFKASNKKTKNVKAVSKNKTKDTNQEPVPKHDMGVVKSNKNVKTLNYPLQNDDSSSDDSSKQKSSDIVKSSVAEKSSNNAKLVSITRTSAKASKNNLVEVNTTEPSKLRETLSSNSRKRKPSTTSNVLIQKDDKNETKTFPGGKQLKRHQSSSSESSDEEEEEIPSAKINLKKSRMEYISDMLRNGRGGAIASTPKSRAVRLNTPNASIIRPTDGKKMNDDTNDSSFKNNSLPGKTFHGQVTRKQQSSSESSSDLSSD